MFWFASHQIRAVIDAFRLIDADADGFITLTDLRDIASWASEDSSTDFINNLVNRLPQAPPPPLNPKPNPLPPRALSPIPRDPKTHDATASNP